MKMRWWLAIGLAAVMVSGVAASVAQLVITRKTQGVLPMGQEPTPASPNGLILAEAPAEAVKVAIVDRPTEALRADPAPLDAPALPAAPAEAVSAPVEVSAALPPPSFDPPQAEQMPPNPPVAEAPPAEVASTAPPAPAAPVDRQVDTVAAPAPPVPASSDPVDTVESFVERNRKEAEEAIRTLSAESENLKKRLTKVETALARWQSFSAALNNEVRIDEPPTAGRSQPPGRWGRSAEAESVVAPASPTQRGGPAPGLAPADPSPIPAASTPAPIDAGPPPAGQSKPTDIPLPTEPEPAPTPTPTPATAPPPQAEPAAIPPTPGVDPSPGAPSVEPAPTPPASGAPTELPPPADAPPALPGLR